MADSRNLKRLLHPGAETKDVITQYISTIRCLRILDPLGVLLHKVAEPIRRHLRDRPDTIPQIVAALVEGEELQDENDPASVEPLAFTNDNTVEKFWDPKWEPEPVDAAPGELRSSRFKLTARIQDWKDRRHCWNASIYLRLAGRYRQRAAVVPRWKAAGHRRLRRR